MAKPQEDPALLEPIAAANPAPPMATVIFRDTVFTSRTLILPDDRTLTVAKGVASANAADDVALKYLKAHAEFEQLKE